MPVQMIELEEVTMVEVNDEAVEASGAAVAYGFTCSSTTC